MLCTCSGWFKHIEPPRTFSNHKDSKVCRVLSHEFGVVRLFSIYIVTKIARCAGCLCTCSGWFKHIEPHRTFSNHIITEIVRCLEFCHMSSGWFDYIVTEIARCAGCLCTCSGWFKHIEPRRTFSNHIITEIARCLEFCHMSSGWFDCTELLYLHRCR